MNLIKLTKSERKRIFSKVVTNPTTNCWIWTGAKNRGYGAFNFRGKTTKIHRLLYEVCIARLPKYDGIRVLDHVMCDNPSCCNPLHVRLVAQSYNILRSNSISGQNARKTHCIHGHPLPKAREQLPSGNFGRRCVICRRRNVMRRYYAKKALAHR